MRPTRSWAPASAGPRRGKGLTLKQLAAQTGLSIGFLSEIERGLAQPSMSSLRKITQNLGISLLGLDNHHGERTGDYGSYAFQPGNWLPKPITGVTLVRAGQRKKLAWPDRPGFYELVTPDLNRNLEVLYLRMPAGSESGPEPIVDSPGEKCLLVLGGVLEMTISGQVTVMNPGDSASYPADAPVSWRMLGDRDGECLIIITPPGF